MTISAKVIKDSLSETNIRLTTMELTYPRFIHSEFMTHREFSRNASSSRAVPIDKMIEAIENNPAMPSRWGLNGKGMQDHGEMSELAVAANKTQWLAARDDAVRHARAMLNRKEVPHKQIVNRILEPFSHITVVMTSTEWDNFFALRYYDQVNPDPTMFALAKAMWEARDDSVPALRQYGDWHLPYVVDEDIEAACLYAFDLKGGALSAEELETLSESICCRISAARCARVSYMTHDKKRPTVAEDLELFSKLMRDRPLHASPPEHQATPDRLANYPNGTLGWEAPSMHGNFVGWLQFRKMFVGEAAVTNSRAITPKLVVNNVSIASPIHTMHSIHVAEDFYGARSA